MHVLDSLLPVFLIIAIGKLLCRGGFMSSGLGKSMNRITYWVALPALLIDKVSTAVFDTGSISRISLLLILATAASALYAWITARLMRIERKATGAFVQGSMRANNAFVGLPVILYAMHGLTPDLEAMATVALAPAIIFYNVSSISILMLFSDRQSVSRAESAKIFAQQLLTNPLLIACAVGLLLNGTGVSLPVALQRSAHTLGNAALALALLSIGASLSFRGLQQGLLRSTHASIIKTVIQPLIGLGLARLWDLPPVERQMLLIYLACPTAVASYVLADLFDSDRDLAAHIIVVSTLCSAVSLSLIVAYGG